MALISALLVSPAIADSMLGPGDLDPSFGGDGLVTTEFGGTYDRALAVAAQDDGKILAGGKGGAASRAAIVRYNTDGTLDASFSGDGKLIIDGSSGGGGLLVLPDGKILVGAASIYTVDPGFLVAKLNSDGSFDTGFGTAGKAIVSMGAMPTTSALVVQPDNKIVVAGYGFLSGDWDFCLARLHADGTLDTSFGGGFVVTDFSNGSPDYLNALITQPDGKLVAAGFTEDASGKEVFALARYQPDGGLDPGFGVGGKVIVPHGTTFGPELLEDLLLLPDGRILACGTGSYVNSVLIRFNPDGSLDESFGPGGRVVTEMVVSNDGFNRIALDAQSRIVALGYARVDNIWRWALARLDIHGTLDPSFGTGGKVISNFGTYWEIPYDLALTVDGKIVGGGEAGIPNSNANFAVARYLAAGAAPTCDAGGPYVAECQGGLTDVALDGTGSFSPGGSPLTYLWTSDCPGASFDDDTSPTPTLTVGSSPGCAVACAVTLTVTDDAGQADTCSTTVTIEDTMPPDITCPADMTVTCGEPTDPDTTGWAAGTDVCDDDPAYPAITYGDVETPVTYPADPIMYTITRTWTATDYCSNSSSCVQTMTVLKEVLSLDIKPGSCPNPLNRKSHGVLPVGLLGTEGFDLTTVDLASVRLSRADGVGVAAAPNEGPPGPHSVFEDVGTPFEGEPCECHDLGGDGIIDLLVKFRVDDIAEALELDSLSAGALVELVVTGMLNDGCQFIAADCVRLVPPGTWPGLVVVRSTIPGVWIDAYPLDLQLDGGGFATFERSYPETSVVTLAAPRMADGRRFVRWEVDGQPRANGERTIDFEIVGDVTEAAAVFRNPTAEGIQGAPVEQVEMQPIGGMMQPTNR